MKPARKGSGAAKPRAKAPLPQQTLQSQPPPAQTWPAGQVLPQVPQFAASVLRFTHCPAQNVVPGGHEPPSHIEPTKISWRPLAGRSGFGGNMSVNVSIVTAWTAGTNEKTNTATRQEKALRTNSLRCTYYSSP